MPDRKTHPDLGVISKLRWRCRRGMRELDVMFSHWLEHEFENARPEHQTAFIALLECEDDQLWDWLTGRSEPDQMDLQVIVRLLRNNPS